MTGRKGYSRRADIPTALLRALNAGTEETVTLAEWLAVDMAAVLDSVLAGAGLGEQRERLVREARALAGQGVTRRVRGIGAILHRATDDAQRRARIFESFAGHRSDIARSFAAYMLTAATSLPFKRRLQLARRFAADPHMAVRETAWDSFRPYLAAELDKGLTLLAQWTRDPDEGIRRCAVEATRPRGVWTEHIEALKQDPEPGLAVLEPVRSDPSRYVQRAVANWINDASKTRPAWARALCRRWKRESPTEATAWIVSHGLRTLRRATG